MNINGTPANLKPFEPGVTRNPGGKPIGARNRLNAMFLDAMADDFREYGKRAIIECRLADPTGYIRAIASLLPKEFVVERPLEGMSDDELTAAIADFRARQAALEDGGAGAPASAGEEPPAIVPA